MIKNHLLCCFFLKQTQNRRIMAPQHVDPEEAVKMHEDLRAKQSVGIHWGTFALAYEVSSIFFLFRIKKPHVSRAIIGP